MSCARSLRPVIAYLSWTEFKGSRGNKALANTPWEGLGRRVGGHQSSLQSPAANSKHRFPPRSASCWDRCCKTNVFPPPQNSSQYLEMRNKDSISRSHLPTSPRSQTNVGRARFGLLNVLAEFSRLLQTERSSSVSDPTHREGQWDAILG